MSLVLHLALWCRSKACEALDGRPISRESEARAFAALRAACAATLRELPTTAQQDEQLVAAPASECARLAIEWRLGHKQ